jgi:hypothetical protein
MRRTLIRWLCAALVIGGAIVGGAAPADAKLQPPDPRISIGR